MAALILNKDRPVKLDLNSELDLLRTNFLQQIRLNGISLRTGSGDMSFMPSNWIITFPYNYYYLTEDVDLELIRKLALINMLYGYYIFAEDDVLDEKQSFADKYHTIILNFCAAHPLRNLAIGFMLELCGPRIYHFIYDYERAYYMALIKEKLPSNPENFNLKSFSGMSVLGLKGIPICIPFAAFCLIKNLDRYIPRCEDLVMNYHIAHQLYDDFIDLKKDVFKPDQSWLIKYISGQLGKVRADQEDISQFLASTNISCQVGSLINNHLSRAIQMAGNLKFFHFQAQIREFRQNMSNFSLKTCTSQI